MSNVEHFAVSAGGEDNQTDFLYIIKKDGELWRLNPEAPDPETEHGWTFLGNVLEVY